MRLASCFKAVRKQVSASAGLPSARIRPKAYQARGRSPSILRAIRSCFSASVYSPRAKKKISLVEEGFRRFEGEGEASFALVRSFPLGRGLGIVLFPLPGLPVFGDEVLRIGGSPYRRLRFPGEEKLSFYGTADSAGPFGAPPPDPRCFFLHPPGNNYPRSRRPRVLSLGTVSIMVSEKITQEGNT